MGFIELWAELVQETSAKAEQSLTLKWIPYLQSTLFWRQYLTKTVSEWLDRIESGRLHGKYHDKTIRLQNYKY